MLAHTLSALVAAGLLAEPARSQDIGPTPRRLPDGEGQAHAARWPVPTAQPLAARVPQRVFAPWLVQARLVPAPIAAGGGTVHTASTYYDNGGTDGTNAYRNSTTNLFGVRHTLLDDFALATDVTSMILSWTHAWGSAQQPPFGTGAEILFRSDQAGQPGAVLFAPPPTSYVETATGRTFFSRPEAQSCVQLDGVSLLAGSTYWVEAAVIGGDENFWLVRSQVKGSECWVNYDDLGGLHPGSAVFGAQADLNFSISTECPVYIPPCEPCTKHISDYFGDVPPLVQNGAPDGSGAYSNATRNVMGARRTLLDDFHVGFDAEITGVRWTHVWDSGALPPQGTGAEFQVRADTAGAPGPVVADVPVLGYCETATGQTFFSRPEVESTISLYPLFLSDQRYWLEGTVVGPENDLWLVKSTVSGEECWVDYEDMGGLMPGSALFGAPADLNFCITGRPALGCLYDNGKTDVSNAFSNATVNVFGARRTLLDDFSLPSDARLTHLSWTHLSGYGYPAPVGTWAEVLLRQDVFGTPGAPITGDLVVGYYEYGTGHSFFTRPECASVVQLAPTQLSAGTYWFEGVIHSPDNNFWLARSTVAGSECWTNYDDLGGLQSSSTVFGTPSDLNFCLDGERTPDVYCDPGHGSANNTSTISASGSSLAAGVSIDLAGGPAGQSCYLLIGNGQGVLHQPPGSKGDLCVVGGTCLGRYAADVGPIDAGGAYHTDLANSQSGGPGYGIPTCGGQIQPGDTWNFQYWHRQPMGTPSTFSQALHVTFVN